LDCAIAKVNSDVAVSNLIEEIGNIGGSGAVAAVNGERVRKRGARTGFTSGTISFIDPTTKEITVTAGAAGGPPGYPGGCTNYRVGETVFSFPGDSGSVYLNDNNEIVGLHYAGSPAPPRSFGKDILQVQTALGITIKTTSATPGRPSESFHTVEANAPEVLTSADTGWINGIEERLTETQSGQEVIKLFRKHEQEIFTLVNKCRPVTLIWQRKQGPAFLAAFGRSTKYPDYQIPAQINRISLPNLLMSMAATLEEHGSEPLRQDLAQYALDIIQLSRECHSAHNFFKILAQLDEKYTIQATVTNH
jgi:hypothetical protein